MSVVTDTLSSSARTGLRGHRMGIVKAHQPLATLAVQGEAVAQCGRSGVGGTVLTTNLT